MHMDTVPTSPVRSGATTTDPDELAAWLQLLEAPGVGAETARRLLAAFGMPAQILAQSHASLLRVVPDAVARALRAAPDARLQRLTAQTVAWVQQAGNYVVTLADAGYPARLLELPDPPALLYVKGRLELLAQPGLGMVGARNATVQGLRDASAFACALAEAGLVITSGLALGIDTAAHEGALQAAGGGTIAVIGTGADIVYPARNRALAHRIAENGVIVSEFTLGQSAVAHHFPRRNRIIAGLSLGVLVVEAALQSGSLITARLAGEYGREVFAMPGSIHSPQAKGCHQLIRQGAKLVESAQDILEELRLPMPPPQFSSVPSSLPSSVAASTLQAEAPTRQKAVPKPTPRRQRALEGTVQMVSGEQTDCRESAKPMVALLQVLGHAPSSLDALCASAGISAAEAVTCLLELELQGHVERLPGERFRRLA